MKVGLLGHGVVGRGVREIIDAHETVYTADLEVTKILVKDESEICDDRMTLTADDILNDPEIDIVAECMGGLEPAHTFVKRALENGKHAVTSNKKMLASFANDLLETAEKSGVQLFYEASCGGGIPWMADLRRIRRIDRVLSFQGIFNGTTNYILSRMDDEGKEFEPLLKEAQTLGYAERNPSDDIDGFDVRYKTALSALAAFDTVVDPADIITCGIRTITKKDMDWGRENGYTVKLLGSGVNLEDCVVLQVMPAFVKKNSVFANVPLNYNAIESVSPTLGKAVFTGQGAGSLPTAHAVVQDLIDISRGVRNNEHEVTKKPVLSEKHEGIYYVRTEKIDLFASFIDQRIDEVSFLTKKVKLAEIYALMQSVNDETLFAAEVIND